MNLFSISQLSQYSGIKPHTIRIWEQRYNAFKPDRSIGNTRYYNNEQLRRLLNIVSLLESGYKVSQLCSMPDDLLYALVIKTNKSAGNDAHEYFVSQMISAGMSYDGDYFEELFEKNLSKFGILKTYKKIIYPMLVRMGLMWSSNILPSAKEHFISNIIRQKIVRSIDSLPSISSSADNWLLFLPENEFHEIGLLFANYIIKDSGRKVIYLGNSVSQESILTAIDETKPSHLLFFIVHYGLIEDIKEYFDTLNDQFYGEKIYVGGNNKMLSQVKFPAKINWLQTIEDLEEAVRN